MSRVPCIELKRHCREFSAEHATEVADIVANLIVNFIKARTGYSSCAEPKVRSETTQASGPGVGDGSAGNPTGGTR
ncbi:MAG: hypothetical protein LC135_03285 [Phycisphaerae bacterium]|nr:hypothetical protein [Phycisphaerae bacterium]MCZ2398878.1 hypothetical protein [Phycisphaerae bacterium]